MTEPGSDPADDVAAAGATDDDARLSVEDDPHGTTDPADLAGTADGEDDTPS